MTRMSGPELLMWLEHGLNTILLFLFRNDDGECPKHFEMFSSCIVLFFFGCPT
jgi:hypothetical protein